MTKILVISDTAARRPEPDRLRLGAWYVTIERVPSEADGWADPDYRLTCSADGGACVRWGLDQTEDQFEDLIANAEKHVELHERGES